MNILLVVDQELQQGELERTKRLMYGIEVFANSRFSAVEERLKERPCDFVIFASFESAFDPSWKVHELKLDIPWIVLIHVRLLELVSMGSFLHSIGVLKEPEQGTKQVLVDDATMVSEWLGFIDRHLFENDLSLDLICSYLYVNRCHFSRVFKEQVGQGFKEYVIQKRLDQAKAMLELGKSVTDVCYSVGFGDLTHFGRMFKKVVGVQPSTYRKNVLGHTGTK